MNIVVIRVNGSARGLDSISSDVPDSYEDAKSRPESRDWLDATTHVDDGLAKVKTWIAGDLPLNKKAIKLRWVFV